MKRLKRFVRWIPGVALVVYGAYLVVPLVQQRRDLEQVEGTVTGFHFHADNPNTLHPSVAFVYKADTVLRHLGPADPLPEKGQSVTLSFPTGKPEVARLLPVEWYWAGFASLAGLWWLGTLVFILKLNSHKTSQRNAAVKTERDYELPRLLLFSSLSVLLIWLTWYLTKTKLEHPDNSTEWGGLIVLGFLAFIFTAICSLGWWSRWIGGETIQVNTDFIRLTGPEVLRSERGEPLYRWKLECAWTDPASGKIITFVSKPFDGRVYYYSRNSIQVSVHPKNPAEYYVVDLTFLSTTNDNGITLISPADYEAATERAEREWRPQKLPWLFRIISRPLNQLVALMAKYPRATRLIGILEVLTGVKRSRWERDPDEVDSGELADENDDIVNEEMTDPEDKTTQP